MSENLREGKDFLIGNSLSMSKGFLDHNLFHDPNVTTIHRDYPDNRAKDVRISILCPALVITILSVMAQLATIALLLIFWTCVKGLKTLPRREPQLCE